MNFIHQHFQYTFAGAGYLAAAIFSISVATIVLIQQPTSRRHISFFLITFFGFMWLLGYAFLNFFKNPIYSILSLRLSYLFGVPFLSPSAYFFSLELRGQPYRGAKLLVSYGVAALLGIFFFCFYHQIVTREIYSWGILNSYQLKNPVGLGYFIAVLGHMFFYAFLAWRHLLKGLNECNTPIERKQFRYFIFSFSIGYLSPTDYLTSVHISNFAFGYVTFSLFVAIVAYVIIRHRFLNINLAIKRFSLMFFIYSSLAALLLPFALPILGRIFAQSDKFALQILFLSIGTGVVLSLGPIIYAYIVRQSFWLRSNLSTGLVHELKSPIGVIQSALDLTIAQLEKPAVNLEKAQQYLQLVRKNADRLDAFVKNLLHVADTTNQAIELRKEQIELSNLIHTIVEQQQPHFDMKGISLATNVMPPFIIEGDPQKLSQVISNLLSNAMKFSDTGTVTIHAQRTSNTVQIKICDEGAGIPHHLQEKIFERFFQVDPGKPGSGIGLSIAKAWVEAHGGKIWAESDGEGKGTTVTFTLPV
jgi:signal transduction histidine kinase